MTVQQGCTYGIYQFCVILCYTEYVMMQSRADTSVQYTTCVLSSVAHCLDPTFVNSLGGRDTHNNFPEF